MFTMYFFFSLQDLLFGPNDYYFLDLVRIQMIDCMIAFHPILKPEHVLVEVMIIRFSYLC